MSVLDTLVTDRTEADVARVKELNAKGLANWTAAERTEWLAGMKGAYNSKDFNRVKAAIEYVGQIYTQRGYDAPLVTMQGISTSYWMEARWTDPYLNNLRTLRGVGLIFPDTPVVPANLNRMTFRTANNIEKILQDMGKMLELMEDSWYYSGEVFCGEV